MRIAKNKALELIDEKIFQFMKILGEATYDNRHNETYNLAYYGAETLLAELFSKEEAMNFRSNVSRGIIFIGGKIDHSQDLQDYKDHISKCIAQLKVL